MKQRLTFPTSLRHCAVLSALLGTISASASAAPPAAPVAPAAPAAKPAAPVAKPAAPGAKPAAPAAPAGPTKAPAPVERKPPVKAAAVPPKAVAAAPQPGATISRDDVSALREENKALREDIKALREDLNLAVGASAVSANPERAQLEAELAEARRKRVAIQTAVDAGLDPAAVADSIKSTDAHIAELEAALARPKEQPTSRSLSELSADVQRLEAAAKREPAATAAAPAPVSATPPPAVPAAAPAELTISKDGLFQPSATLQVWAFVSHLANDATPDESWTHTLRIRRAELKIKGEIVRKTFAYAVMFDPARLLDFSNKTIAVTGEMPAPTTAGSVSVAQPPAGGNTSILQDASLTYLSDYADVSLGQFKIPVSLEGSGSASKLYFPERALISRKYGDRRDIGAKAEKKFDKFGYTLGLYNGEGQNKLDSNKQKDLALRLEAYPVKDVTVAVVGYTGLTERDKLGTKDRVEGDVKVERSGFLLQAEYIRGWDMAGTAAAHRRVEGQGFYALAGYTFFDKLQPVVRIGALDPDIGQDEKGATALDPNDETTSYELGVNYYFKGNDAKVQLAGGCFDPEQRSQHTRCDFTLATQLAF